MGLEFQAHPRDEPSQVILHVRMPEAEAALQQEAIGVVGITSSTPPSSNTTSPKFSSRASSTA